MIPSSRSGVIRVLVVDDSEVERQLLVYLFNAEADIEVVGVAGDGEQAIIAAQRLKPDVITMDIHLPKMNGYVATRKIMETCPTRILMVTASTVPSEVVATFHSLEAGALGVLAKPQGPGHSKHQTTVNDLLRTVRLMAEVRVVKRWTSMRDASVLPCSMGAPKIHETPAIKIVAIGASTGGPLALQTILSHLPSDFGVPILIVQHISAGFCHGMTEWLGRTSGYSVRIGTNEEMLQPGVAYFAPDDMHMLVRKNGTIQLLKGPPEHDLRPSVSSLFRSVAATYGAHAVGVLLTGMGRDGARELKLMQEAGAVTIVQDKETSVVYGMPGEAVKLNAARYTFSPKEIATVLYSLVNRNKAH